MYKVLDKDTIKNEILPHLSVAKRGYICQSSLSEVIQCILYKLKTGCQWYMLPVSSFFITKPYMGIFANGVRKENGKKFGQHF